jgi:hypothetical protein
MRIMQLRRRELKIRDKVKTKCQLVVLKRVLLQTLEEMGLRRSKVRNIKVRFGQSYEFEDCTSYYDITNDEIVLPRGIIVASMIVEIAHEIGHKVTRFGTFGICKKKRNIIGEVSAYNFEVQVRKNFYKRKGIIILRVVNFIKTMKRSPVHYISYVLRDIPLGLWIRKQYK